MNEYLRQLIERFRELWGRLSPVQKGLATGVPVLLFVLLALVLAAISRPPESYGVLFSELAREDASVIVGKLKGAGVQYKLKDDGTVATIEVPTKDVYDLRLQLAGMGLPKGAGVGFELFDKGQVLGTTESQQRVNYLRALQGELTRTVMSITEVRMARVNLALPQESLYSDTAKQPTASVMVEIKRGYRMEPEQVRGIIHLVASSVEGLKPVNVRVVDNHGKVLSDLVRDDLNEEAGGEAASLTRQSKLARAQQAVQSGIEKEMERRVDGMLNAVLGEGRYTVKVTAEVNFDQVKMTSKTFEPVVGNKGIERSSQTRNENYNGVGGIPGGVPGVESNIPGYQAVVGGNLNYNKQEDTRNYELNEKVEEVIKAPGGIKRLNVAVFIDNVQPQQKEQIQRALTAAAGIDTARGDSIVVENLPFDKTLAAQAALERSRADKQEQEKMWIDVVKYATVAVVALLVIFFMMRLVRPRVVRESMVVEVAGSGVPEPEPEPEPAPPPPPPPPPPVEEVAPPPPLLIEPEPTAALERQRRQQIRQHVNRLARSRPEMIAQIIKRWLTEDKR